MIKANSTRLGWIPDLPDHRDHLYSAPAQYLRKMPASVDLRRACPPVYDQGDLGSCTANAIAAAIEFDQMKQKLKKVFLPSRLFIYYNERVMEGTVDADSGAQIRDGIKSVVRQGDCPERMWPYIIDKFSVHPPASCYDEAKKHEVVRYQRLTRELKQMKGCLASGYPFVFGFSVYESFMSAVVAASGDAPMPKPRERIEGGHAVMAVGYDENEQRFLVRNSWGAGWGRKGYFTMPFAYLLGEHLADDFWTIRAVG
jgi:C1A family cysteine protease